MSSIFRKSLEMNLKIEKFLSTISESMILFEDAIVKYLNKDLKGYEDTYIRIKILETEADALEKDITVSLYQFMLLPDTRADVLLLIKSLDNIIDKVEEIGRDLKIERPSFPEILHKDLVVLLKQSIQSAEALLMAIRSFFNAVHLVPSQTQKVKFYEHEADLVEEKLLSLIFNSEHALVEKIYYKNYVSKIAWIADESESIGNMLEIYTVKREV